MRNIDLGIARIWAREMQSQVLCEGARAVDATMGNGYDTLFLCQNVGKSGKVWAFDVQPQALESTRNRLAENGFGITDSLEADSALGADSALRADSVFEPDACTAELILSGHENVDEFVHEPIDLAVFNLGWLPGAEHGIRTQRKTTLAAIEKCLALLRPGGLCTICIYPGHEEGREELAAIVDFARGLDPLRFDAVEHAYLNQPLNPPVLVAIAKAAKPRKAR